jgi:hypothetical protein
MTSRRQAIINTLGLCLIITSTLQNVHMKRSLDASEEEFAGAQADQVKFKALQDETWLHEAGVRVRNGNSSMKEEIHKRLGYIGKVEGKQLAEVNVKDAGRIF